MLLDRFKHGSIHLKAGGVLIPQNLLVKLTWQYLTENHIDVLLHDSYVHAYLRAYPQKYIHIHARNLLTGSV